MPRMKVRLPRALSVFRMMLSNTRIVDHVWANLNTRSRRSYTTQHNTMSRQGLVSVASTSPGHKVTRRVTGTKSHEKVMEIKSQFCLWKPTGKVYSYLVDIKVQFSYMDMFESTLLTIQNHKHKLWDIWTEDRNNMRCNDEYRHVWITSTLAPILSASFSHFLQEKQQQLQEIIITKRLIWLCNV